MSTGVQFDRAKLIAAVTKARENIQAELDDHAARVEKYRERQLAAWQDQRPQLIALRDKLTAALRTGKPVTPEQVRVGGKGLGDLLYSRPSDFLVNREVKGPQSGSPKLLRERVALLTGLVDLLEVQTGDTVSANQLRTLGYTRMFDVFRDAALQADGLGLETTRARR